MINNLISIEMKKIIISLASITFLFGITFPSLGHERDSISKLNYALQDSIVHHKTSAKNKHINNSKQKAGKSKGLKSTKKTMKDTTKTKHSM
jgi:hypothetical protein